MSTKPRLVSHLDRKRSGEDFWSHNFWLDSSIWDRSACVFGTVRKEVGLILTKCYFFFVDLRFNLGGRPDTMKLVKEAYKSWNAEVVFITSNYQGNQELMEGCKEAGIPVFVSSDTIFN